MMKIDLKQSKKNSHKDNSSGINLKKIASPSETSLLPLNKYLCPLCQIDCDNQVINFEKF